ncbi:undecaprenyl-diphosphatase, partial [Candidatus Kuenenbacteria bacterium CG_4_8_14_3_um_filter_39_15]
PLMLGAGILKFFEMISREGLGENGLALAAGFVSTLISGIIAIKLLLWLAEKANFNVFVIYRILLGIVLLLV